jgi:hypothetical protein
MKIVLDEIVTWFLTLREEEGLRVLQHVMLGRYLCLRGKNYRRMEKTAL